MPKKRKRLSRAHRAAIRRGLLRYYRRERRQRAQRNARRRQQAKARRELQRLQRIQREHREEWEEWELTIRYGERGKAVGVTMRIRAPKGASRDVVQLVAKRAGMPGGEVEKGFRVRDINWQKPRKSYDYGDDIETGLQVSGWTGLFASSEIRVDRVQDE